MVLLLDPSSQDASQLLLQSKLNCLCKPLLVWLETPLDRAEAVKVQDVKAVLLHSRHDVITKELDQHDSTLWLFLDHRYHLVQFLFPQSSNFAPFLEYSDTEATFKMTLG